MKKRVVIGGAALALIALSIGWASASSVQSEIRDYQKRGACYRADLSFDGKVTATDLSLIKSMFGNANAPSWFDQDGDKVISILDIASVAGQVDKECRYGS